MTAPTHWDGRGGPADHEDSVEGCFTCDLRDAIFAESFPDWDEAGWAATQVQSVIAVRDAVRDREIRADAWDEGAEAIYFHRGPAPVPNPHRQP